MFMLHQIDGLVQERHNTIANALELGFLTLTHSYDVRVHNVELWNNCLFLWFTAVG